MQNVAVVCKMNNKARVDLHAMYRKTGKKNFYVLSVENYRDVGALPLYLLIIAKLLRVHLFRKKIYIAAEELSSEHRSPAELFSYVKNKTYCAIMEVYLQRSNQVGR